MQPLNTTLAPLQFTNNVNVTVTDSVITNNVAGCQWCAGGGLALFAGGLLKLLNCTIAGNVAGQAGGGISLGLAGKMAFT